MTSVKQQGQERVQAEAEFECPISRDYRRDIMMNQALLTGYNVHREEDRQALLKAVGAAAIEDLFSQIPAAIRLQRPLNLPEPMSEWEMQKRFRELASRNASTRTHLSLLGGGAYEHYIPAVVSAIASRGEYLTAYTPYQPEMSQGFLRILYDFQAVMGRLLGLPAVNCSVYDGATALAESAWMACSIKAARRLVVADTIWPEWRAVLKTYMDGRGVTLVTVPCEPASGRLSLAHLDRELALEPAAAALVQSPNRLGVIERTDLVSEICRRHQTLLNVSCYPLSLGCLKSPGEMGADIATAEGQCLGLPLNSGGPYLGIMATRPEYEKFLPGRIVGICEDIKGEPALALVKEEREQHVSRDKATSHICSNQALMALRALVYLCVVGEQGLRRIAELNAAKAHDLCDQLCALPGVRRTHDGPFFNEFMLTLPCEAEPLLTALQARGIFGGLNGSRFDPALSRHLLVAVTETKSKAELDRIGQAFREALS